VCLCCLLVLDLTLLYRSIYLRGIPLEGLLTIFYRHVQSLNSQNQLKLALAPIRKRFPHSKPATTPPVRPFPHRQVGTTCHPPPSLHGGAWHVRERERSGETEQGWQRCLLRHDGARRGRGGQHLPSFPVVRAQQQGRKGQGRVGGERGSRGAAMAAEQRRGGEKRVSRGGGGGAGL